MCGIVGYIGNQHAHFGVAFEKKSSRTKVRSGIFFQKRLELDAL